MDQINLALFGMPTGDEEAIKLAKKISKITGYPEIEYITKSREQLEVILAEEEAKIKAKEEAEKAAKALEKEIEKIKKEMTESNLQYDENKSLEQNKKLLKETKDQIEDRKKNPKYKYPFRIYFKGCDIQEPDHIFETDKEYTAKEITSRLFKAGYKEFAGEVKVNYDKEDNMIVPEFTSQRHG